ncbi:uncharacterized protein LOC120290524 [Eucalyptus grandis]|uniref:uncharacterized protein LOC120290524 n=1 Tax=Eucalyptus grandis TaxID=71139 RepID=UPI00192ECB75|nr:uncharacterized protein LOC120290524 [Eucalyptus grandis]
MPGLDPDIIEHALQTDPNVPPKKKRLRRTKPKLSKKIEGEVMKLLKVDFIEVSHYSDWIANIVPIMKKDGWVRVCVDYHDLNRASLKDNFPIPHIDVLVDSTTGFELFSFMDGCSGYQIRMKEEDRSKTSFITPWGTFCYRVMPLGLKNAEATYQRAMVTLFHDMMHEEIELSETTKPFFKLLKKIAKIEWDAECQEFDIQSLGQSSVKGCAIADMLAETSKGSRASDEDSDADERILLISSDKWAMYFDGPVNLAESSTGIVLISLDGQHYTVAAKLMFPCTNNVAKYTVCILGLQVAIDMKIHELQVYGELMKEFQEISFEYLPRSQNQFADALATLSSVLQVTGGMDIEPLRIEILRRLAYCMIIEEEPDGEPWYCYILDYLQNDRVVKAFNRKVRPRHFEVNDLVLRKVLPIIPNPRGKFTPNYEGPYVVKKILLSGDIVLVEMDDRELSKPVNADAIDNISHE